jgi:2-alkyl-3-oxoalkanoate reductase
MKILVTGGFGFVGSKTVTALVRAGHCVRVLDVADHPLRGKFAELWASMGEVDIVEGDISVYRDVERAVAGCDRVLHSAALLNSTASYSVFHRVNTLGTKNVCQASLVAGVERVVVISTSDVFGIPKPGQTLNEQSELRNWGEPYADTKIKAIKTVRRYRDQRGLPVTLIYPGWVYGPGDRQFFPALLDMLRDKHVFTWEKRNPYEINLIYIDDLIEAILKCLLLHPRNGEYLILETNTSMTPEKLLRFIAEFFQMPVRVHHLPYFVMFLIAFCSQWLARRKIIRKQLLSTTDVKAFGHEFHFSNQHAAEELSWRPVTPLEVGLRRSLEWQRLSIRPDFNYAEQDFERSEFPQLSGHLGSASIPAEGGPRDQRQEESVYEAVQS